MRPGLFIVFDGLDGTGKSTQCQRVAEWLTSLGIPVSKTRDPGGTELAMRIREIVLHCKQHRIGVRTEALLFGAARADLVEHVIRPALARGEVVLSDRYSLANVVYQGHAGGLDPDMILELERFVTDDLAPALTLIFDLPLAESAKRRQRDDDRMEAKGSNYLERVRTGFLAEAKREPRTCTVIDASGSPDVVFERVRTAILPLLATSGFAV
jgi:dTMP kinase